MPLLGQNPNGSWMPQYGAGNWVGTWGARPADFGRNTAYSYFQQNPMQMQNYNSGQLGRAFTNWFGGGVQQGPINNPNQPPRPPMNPYQTLQGQAPDNIGGEYIKPTMVGNTALGQSIQQPYQPPPQLPNAGATQPPRPQIGGFLPPRQQPGMQQGIGGFRGRGWF